MVLILIETVLGYTDPIHRIWIAIKPCAPDGQIIYRVDKKYYLTYIHKIIGHIALMAGNSK